MKIKFMWMLATASAAVISCNGSKVPVEGSGSSRGPKTISMPQTGTQLDRAGRVAVSTGLIQTFNPDTKSRSAGKKAFNRADKPAWSRHIKEAEQSLAILDGLDATCGNQLLAAPNISRDRYKALATVLMDDQLYLDTSRGTCGQYLGLEAEAVGALPVGKGGCGGRTPLDDVIETTYSTLAVGALAGVDDTLTGDGSSHSTTDFPFLAPPPTR